MSRHYPAHIARVGLRHVFIRNLELNVRIGVYRHEQGKTQPVRINIDLAVTETDDPGDELAKVVDYGAVEQKVRALVAEGHVRLAETLAERIAAVCLEDGRVETVRVRVEKLHALAGAESAGVEIERAR